MWATPDKGSHCGKRAVTRCRRPEREIGPTQDSMLEGRDRCAWDWGGKGCFWHLWPGDPRKWEFI